MWDAFRGVSQGTFKDLLQRYPSLSFWVKLTQSWISAGKSFYRVI